MSTHARTGSTNEPEPRQPIQDAASGDAELSQNQAVVASMVQVALKIQGLLQAAPRINIGSVVQPVPAVGPTSPDAKTRELERLSGVRMSAVQDRVVSHPHQANGPVTSLRQVLDFGTDTSHISPGRLAVGDVLVSKQAPKPAVGLVETEPAEPLRTTCVLLRPDPNAQRPVSGAYLATIIGMMSESGLLAHHLRQRQATDRIRADVLKSIQIPIPSATVQDQVVRVVASQQALMGHMRAAMDCVEQAHLGALQQMLKPG